MKDLQLWRFISDQLNKNEPVMFLCVPESSGSSPGRKGFKMAVSKNEMLGSVGGGIMEHKFVMYAKELLDDDNVNSILKKQVHSKQQPNHQSGMICSGEQTLALYRIKKEDHIAILAIIHAMENHQTGYFTLSPEAILFYEKLNENITTSFQKESDKKWMYTETITFENYLYIIGGGHVSLAFSKLMRQLNFHITVFDDREKLNTFEKNVFAHQKKIIDYENIVELIGEEENQYIVIMTFGYRTDGIVIRQLLTKNYKYIGLLGSKTKIAKLLSELHNEGFDEFKIKAVHAPVGLSINSRTPEEIAISIAAEIIQVKNTIELK